MWPLVLLLVGWSADASAIVFASSDGAPILVESAQVQLSESEVPPAQGEWLPVDLPHRWGAEVSSEGSTVWYRVQLRMPPVNDGDWSVYLPKVSMNADLWINGSLAARIGGMDQPLTRHWNTPLLLRIPAPILRSGLNDVQIRVRARDRHDGGLGRFWIGPSKDLAPLADRARFWRITMVDLLATFVLALALVVAVVWARRPERLEYLYFSLGAIGCAVSSLNMSVSNPVLSDPTWEILTHIALHAGVLCLALFGLEFSGASTRYKRWVMLIFLLVDLAAQLLLDGVALRIAVTTFSLIIFSVAAIALVSLVRKLRQQPLADSIVFGLAAVTTVLIGGYDWLVVSGTMPYESVYALPYIWPVLLGAFAWLIAGDYARTQGDLAALNAQLSERIEVREQALQETFRQLRDAERAQAVAEERSRILRDMHDGVGAHLVTALRQLQSTESSRDQVAYTLRDSLDYLKLSIDGMTLPPGDLNSLLAALRYRLTSRLEAAGLSIEWMVNEMPIWKDGLRDGFMRHLQYLLFELISNVLQHAGANVIEIGARVVDGVIELRIVDDGRGMASDVRLRSSEMRAKAIGARLVVDRRQPGCRVSIYLANA